MELTEGELVTYAGSLVVRHGRAIRGNSSYGEQWVFDDGVNWFPRPVLFQHREGIEWRRGHVDVSDLIAAWLLTESARA